MSGMRSTQAEKAVILEHWNTQDPIRVWAHLLPNRSEDAIIGIARRMGLGKRNLSRKPSYVQSWDCMQILLKDGKPRSVSEIAEKTGFDCSSIRKQVKDRIGTEVYVAGWRFEENRNVALIMLGRQQNAPRPPAKTKAQVQKVYINRTKMLRPEKYEEYNRRRRVAASAKAEKPVRADIAASWMMGALS